MEPGWYEFHSMPAGTTHIAYVYSDGSAYLPEGLSITNEVEFRWAVQNGHAHRLVREDEAQLPFPPRTIVNRILWRDRDDNVVDEIVLHDATVHVEQMNPRCWWIGISLAAGGYWAGNFTCDSRGRMRFSEQERDGFEWDDDQEHLAARLRHEAASRPISTVEPAEAAVTPFTAERSATDSESSAG